MNEKLQYASMLDIPVNSCNITYAPVKKRKGKSKKAKQPEDVKKELLDKVNGLQDGEAQTVEAAAMPEHSANGAACETETVVPVATDSRKKKRDKARGIKFTIVTAQFILIGALVATIFLTNAFYKNSGINTFMRSVFTSSRKTEEIKSDNRTYGDFKPVISYGEGSAPVIENGVMTITGKGSVYTPYDGKVTKVTVDGAGKYSLEIAHSDNFKTVISGLDHAYAEINDQVFGNIPVGYAGESGIEMCFLGSDGAVITDYTLEGNAVVWKAV